MPRYASTLSAKFRESSRSRFLRQAQARFEKNEHDRLNPKPLESGILTNEDSEKQLPVETGLPGPVNGENQLQPETELAIGNAADIIQTDAGHKISGDGGNGENQEPSLDGVTIEVVEEKKPVKEKPVKEKPKAKKSEAEKKAKKNGSKLNS